MFWQSNAGFPPTLDCQNGHAVRAASMARAAAITASA
jgi:hypothetical protein